jgi:hypothetical protein
MANPFGSQDDAAVNAHTDAAAVTAGSTGPGSHAVKSGHSKLLNRASKTEALFIICGEIVYK